MTEQQYGIRAFEDEVESAPDHDVVRRAQYCLDNGDQYQAEHVPRNFGITHSDACAVVVDKFDALINQEANELTARVNTAIDDIQRNPRICGDLQRLAASGRLSGIEHLNKDKVQEIVRDISIDRVADLERAGCSVPSPRR